MRKKIPGQLPETILNKLKPRARSSHKGNFGRVLIVAGSEGYTGAAHLAGQGALRAGAGLVTLAVPRKVYSVVARREAEVMVRPFSSTKQGSFSFSALKPLQKFSQNQNVLAVGPGLSTHPQTVKLVRKLVGGWSKQLVIDADGLNALGREIELLKTRLIPAILTPHAGEFVRLFGGPLPVTAQERIKRALKAACDSNSIVVLKGNCTVVAAPRKKAFVNSTGNPGMASGGTGDVLTGIIAALLGQGLEPWDAARIGVYVHGLAGDFAARGKGEISLTAGDLVEKLPEAFKKVSGAR